MGVSRKIAASAQPLYETDFYAWSEEQARAIREGRFEDLDIENVAEEIEDLGKRERRELQNRLEVILSHLLKWVYLPRKRTSSWRNTIREQRRRLADHLDENRSLKPELEKVSAKAYGYAMFTAGDEMGLDERAWQRKFPAKCPWSAGQILDESFLPDSPARKALD
jgi:hypothetical protein